MTVYVIDRSNPLPPTTGDYEHALQLNDGDTVLLGEGAEIRASGFMADGINASGRVNLLIDGSVSSAQSYGISMSGTLTIGQSGSVSGAEGLVLGSWFDPLSFVNNAGMISGKDVAIFIQADHATITNSGTITGDNGIWAYPTDSGTSSLTVTNTGVIEGTGGTAILGKAHSANVIGNSGLIKGSVFLGYGNDVYDGRAGSITGDLYLYSGDDVALGGVGSEKFHIDGGRHFIDGGEGIDTIYFRRQTFVDLRVTSEQKTSDTSWDTIRHVENLVGSMGADRFYGSDDANVLDGAIGNDILEGNGGDDRLIGGRGNDSISGGLGVDVAEYSGNFADYTIQSKADGSYSIVDIRTGANDGTDILIGIEFVQFADRTIALTSSTNSAPTSIGLDATKVDGHAKAGALVGHLSGVDPDGDPLGYFLASNPGGHFRIQGDQLLVDKTFEATDTAFDIVVRASDPKGASLDKHFTITVSHDGVMSLREGGSAEAEISVPGFVATGGKRADILVGGGGDDRLDGRSGRDKLMGRDGHDAFVFSTKLGKGNVDRILDFVSGEDAIQLSARIFKGLGRGALSKDAFHVGAKAGDADDRIIYNAKTGVLSYDADGSGSEHAAIKFAVLSHKPHLSAADFLVV